MRWGTRWVRLGSMPPSRSSSSVPSTATRSPATTLWSRPGHWAISLPSPGMMATGARLPKCPRKVACAASDSTTSTCTTANCTPPSSMSCALRPRQASTNDGPARVATSSTLPRPDTRSRARATEGLASWVTMRTSGRISLIRRAVSSAWISFTSAQTTARACSNPASKRASPIYAVRWRCGTPQSSSRRANRLSAESSTTRTGVPLRWSCSTMRSPTPWSPQTIT